MDGAMMIWLWILAAPLAVCRYSPVDQALNKPWYGNPPSHPMPNQSTARKLYANPDSTSPTSYMAGSERVAAGSYSMGATSFIYNNFAYFGTFDLNGRVERYSFPPASGTDGPKLEETIEIGAQGGKYLFSAAVLPAPGGNGPHGFFGSAIVPSAIVSVALSPSMTFSSTLALSASLGGVVNMDCDAALNVCVVIMSDPLNMLLIDVSDPASMTIIFTLLVSNHDTCGAVSDKFLDTTNRIAYVVATEGNPIKVPYTATTLGAAVTLPLLNYQGFGAYALQSTLGQLLIFATSPDRTLVTVSVSTGEMTGYMSLTKDMSYIVGIWSDDTYAYVVGRSHRGIVSILQYEWSKGPLTNTVCEPGIGGVLAGRPGCNWGLVAGGYCKHFTWQECVEWGRRCSKHGCWSVCESELTYAGCFYYPIGKLATGAALGGGKFVVATEAIRCTICTGYQRLFPKDELLCISESETDSSEYASCPAKAHNSRNLIWNWGFSEGDMNHETNHLYGYVNTTIQQFQLGDIKSYGDLHVEYVSACMIIRAPVLLLLLLWS